MTSDYRASTFRLLAAARCSQESRETRSRNCLCADQVFFFEVLERPVFETFLKEDAHVEDLVLSDRTSRALFTASVDRQRAFAAIAVRMVNFALCKKAAPCSLLS